MKKHLNHAELIDRLSDYEGRNFHNCADRFIDEAGGIPWLAESLAQEDALLKRIARQQARELAEVTRFDR